MLIVYYFYKNNKQTYSRSPYPLTNKLKAFHKIKSINKIDDYEVSYGFYRKPSQCEGFERNCTIFICIGKETLVLDITMRDLILGASPLTNKFKAFHKIKSINKIDDYGAAFGFYSNGNNECNRNELGRLLIYQLDAL